VFGREGDGFPPLKAVALYHFVGANYIVLGPCRFTTLEYQETLMIHDDPSHFKITYVPDIQLMLPKHILPFPDVDPKFTIEVKPTKLETEFQTLRE
jgi:hypothetical protein